MINISLPNALRIWSELEAAYYGDNKHGGTVAEIYAHTIKPLSNAARLHFGDRNGGMKSTIGKECFEEEGAENREILMELIRLFEEIHKCEITIQGLDKFFVHRCHVHIDTKDPIVLKMRKAARHHE